MYQIKGQPAPKEKRKAKAKARPPQKKMVRKKLDARIRTLIERSVGTGQRSMLVLVGDHGKDQVPNLHQLLARTSVRARPKVLWCYKKELGFSTHRMKVRSLRWSAKVTEFHII